MALDLELTQAITNKELDKVKTLLQQRISEHGPNAVNMPLSEGPYTGWSLLAVAAVADDLAIIGHLITQKANIEQANIAASAEG